MTQPIIANNLDLVTELRLLRWEVDYLQKRLKQVESATIEAFKVSDTNALTLERMIKRKGAEL